jgi:hypothetical protein
VRRRKAYEGFEAFTNAFKMHFPILMGIFMLQIVFLIWITDFRRHEIRFLLVWCKVRVAASLALNLKVSIPLPDGNQFSGYARDIQSEDNLRAYAAIVKAGFYRKFLLSFYLYLLYALLIYDFKGKPKSQATRNHIRGVRLVAPREYIKLKEQSAKDNAYDNLENAIEQLGGEPLLGSGFEDEPPDPDFEETELGA